MSQVAENAQSGKDIVPTLHSPRSAPDSFTAHILRFTAEVTEPMLLNEHKGSALRGAFYNALTDRYCFNNGDRKLTSCHPCPLHATCPICTLVATVDEGGQRGADPPRPFVIDPPLDPRTYYRPGDIVKFGMTLFGDGLKLFPYVVVAFQEAGLGGLGKRFMVDGPRPRQGKYTLRRVEAVNPLTREIQTVKAEGDNLIRVPNIPVTHAHVIERVEGGGWRVESNSTVTLRLLTPMRLVEGGHLLHPLRFRPLVQRLFERLSGLTAYYSSQKLEADFPGLLAVAEGIEIVEDQTKWLELESYSGRQRRRTPMGGLVGEISFAGEIAPFLPYLLWGQFTHLGKDATKGNGWYEVLS